MKAYIALLRGINVGGQKKMPMKELREMMVNAEFKDIHTYIQSGNIIFKSDLDSNKKLESLIQTSIKTTFGFVVPVIVKSVFEIKDILDKNPYDNKDDLAENRVYFVLLQNTPNQELVKALKDLYYPNEKFSISNECVYLCCKTGYGKARLNNNLIELKLGVRATARNYRTMNKLLELAS